MTGAANGQLILAGDIGGTKTNLGLFSAEKERPEPTVVETYSSVEAAGLEELIDRFLQAYPARVKAAAFGIAGPVINGVCKATNLPWTVSEAEIGRTFGWSKVVLLNDLAATAHALPVLDTAELERLNDADFQAGANVGLAAPGTGLGISLATVVDRRIYPLPSEGGHVDFAPRNEREIELLRFMWKQYRHVSVERLVSGPGLATIYQWLGETSGKTSPDWLVHRLSTEDPPKVISQVAMDHRDDLCVEALDIFVSILGAVAGNLALVGFTSGGLFLGGGIPPKILPKLRDGAFMQAFTDKGRFAGLLERIPVAVILNSQAALLGAACRAHALGTGA